MAHYNMRTDGELRTDAYQFTVESLDDPAVAQLRAQVKKHNADVRAMARKWGRASMADNLKVVRIMPRGPRRDIAREKFAGWGFRGQGAYDSYLPLCYGTHFDIYIQRSDKAYQLKREIETGVSQGQRRRIEKFEDEQRMRSYKFDQAMRDEGLYDYGGEWYDIDTAIAKIEEDGHHSWAKVLKEKYYG